MSISKFQDKFLKPGGCSVIVGVFALIGLSATMTSQCSRQKQMEDQRTGADRIGPPVMSIGDLTFTSDQISKLFNERVPAGGDPAQDAAQFGFVLTSLAEPGYSLALAKSKGVTMDDAALMAYGAKQLDSNLMNMKFSLMMGPNAKPITDKEFEDKIKERTGKTLAELKKDQADKLKEQIADPKVRPLLVADAIRDKLVETYQANVHPTDDDVKTALDSITVKRLTTKDKAKADEALKAIQGGASIESQIDKLSPVTVPGAKKASEDSPIYNVIDLRADSALKPILSLKQGQVSSVIDLGENFIIVKRLDEHKIPRTDFEKNKSTQIAEYQKRFAQAQLDADLRYIHKTVKPVFTDKGLEFIDHFSELQSKGPISLDTYKQLANDSKSIDTNYFKREMAFMRYAISKFIADKSPIDQAAQDDLIEKSLAVLEFTESFDLRMTLVDKFVAKKDAKQAWSQLAEAASANSLPDAIGQSRYNRVNSELGVLQSAKLSSPDDEAKVKKAQDAWRKEFKEKQDADAENKRKQAEMDAQNKKDKADAEAEKAKAKAGTPNPAPAPTKK